MMTTTINKESSIFISIAYASIVGCAFWWLWNYVRGSGRPRRRERSWSFSSRAMIFGVFPSSVEYPDPIIHGTMFFTDCPSPQDIVSDVIPKLLLYDRLRTIPLARGNRNDSRKCVNLDPSKLVRHVVVKGTDQSTIDAIQSNLHKPLSHGRGDLPWWEFLLVENQGEGQSACVWRVHHSLGDGLSLIKVFQDISMYSDGTPLTDIFPKGMERKFQKISWWKAFWSTISASIHVFSLPMRRKDDGTVFSKWNQTYEVCNLNKFRIPLIAISLYCCIKSGVQRRQISYCFRYNTVGVRQRLEK
jgi:hypothetical protein